MKIFFQYLVWSLYYSCMCRCMLCAFHVCVCLHVCITIRGGQLKIGYVLYVCMHGWYTCFLKACVGAFPPPPPPKKFLCFSPLFFFYHIKKKIFFKFFKAGWGPFPPPPPKMIFGLDPTFLWYYSIKQVLLETLAPNCEIILVKR